METRNEVSLVGELAGQDHRKAEVFQKYGIDFCCGGGRTLAEAAREAGIPEEELRAALAAAELSGKKPELDYTHRTPGELIREILDTHHQYVREIIPVLLEYGRKVAGHHGIRHPELVELDLAIRSEAQDLLEHLQKEEQVLFPAIEWLAAPDHGNPTTINMDFVGHAVERMMLEHTTSGESLERFRRITDNYTPPAEACNSYRFLYAKLKEFDEDLHQHIHKENNILFPRALALLAKTK